MATLDRRGFLAVAVGSVAVVAGAGCSRSAALGGDSEASDDGPIRLGLTTALTGAYSEFGVPMKNSVDLAIEQANAGDGVLGRKVELVTYDDQLVAEKAQSNMRRLLDEDQVDYVLSPAGSGPTLAVLPLVNAKKRIMMNTIAQTSTIVYPDGESEPPYGNVFSFALGNSVESEFLGGLLSREFGKVGLLTESTPYGETGRNALVSVLEKGGETAVVAKESYDQQTTDMTAQLARLRKSGAEAIVLIGLGSDAATARQTMARLDLMRVPFVIANGAGTPPYEERAKKLVDGTIAVHYKEFRGDRPSTPSAREFADAYLEAHGHDRYYGKNRWPIPSFGSTAASSYDSVVVLLEAVRRAGTTDQATVSAALESGKPFTGARGDYRFTEDVHAAVTPALMALDVYRMRGDEVGYEPYEA